MRLYLLQLCAFLFWTFSVDYCNAQEYISTIRTKQDKGGPVCGTVQRDVRGTFKKGLGNAGTDAVALFSRTSFSKNENGKTLVKTKDIHIDLQGMFDQYGKRWANLQIQMNGAQTSPTTIGTVFLEAGKTFPIRLIKNALVVSMQQCAKVWLEIAPKAGVPNDP
ncbi:hypothetical protein DAPPUDRAFT_304016 [Daphnia pulex]|uniref:Uncharacterized protein n=1 Tax=Daphnia pulex TaxID=6669 RepID=E9GJ56_DAPPU|nr:hypothetical protein DAPPUDRAFT_304016 [Daphnia pulex]|eukprot:EFX80543.1 hypothetical protein DAPPUDRAFT_304016 [Daphnia pulex]